MFVRNQGGNASATRPYFQGEFFCFSFYNIPFQISYTLSAKIILGGEKGWEA